MEFKHYINKILTGGYLSRDEAYCALVLICSDKTIHTEQIAAFLAILHSRQESSDEIAGFLQYLKEQIQLVETHSEDVLDICGTGGDNCNTFNISTASAILLASGGVKVAKHGAKAVSSKSGSAEVLEHLKIPVFDSAQKCSEMLKETGFVFLLASNFNPVYQQVRSLRQKIGIRTSFNLCGPLLNPAMVKKQIIGVYDKKLLPVLANALLNTNIKEAMIIHSDDGMDEFSLNATTHIAHVKNNAIYFSEFNPREYDLSIASIDDIKGGTPHENACIIEDIFLGVKSLKRKIVLLNAAFGFIMAGIIDNFTDAYAYGAQLIDRNIAYNYLLTLRQYK